MKVSLTLPRDSIFLQKKPKNPNPYSPKGLDPENPISQNFLIIALNLRQYWDSDAQRVFTLTPVLHAGGNSVRRAPAFSLPAIVNGMPQVKDSPTARTVCQGRHGASAQPAQGTLLILDFGTLMPVQASPCGKKLLYGQGRQQKVPSARSAFDPIQKGTFIYLQL